MADLMPFVCSGCRTKSKGVWKSTFLGFKRFICPQCEAKTVYPLRTGYRIFYWILMVLLAALMVYNLIHGRIAIPGFLAIAGLIGLILDAGVKKKIRELESQAAEPPPIPTRPTDPQ